MESIGRLFLCPGIIGLEERYRDISGLGLPFISPRGSRFSTASQPGDIDSRSRIFAGTTEIAAGNDAATMFTQTPRVETIRQDSRVRARGLLAVKLARSSVCTCASARLPRR